MRIFFLFLLLLNILFAGWQYYQPAKNRVEIQPLPEKLKTLVLLSESNLPLMVAEKTMPGSPEKDSRPDDLKLDQQSKQIVCFTLGPFTDQEQVKSIQREISPLVSSSELRKRVEKELHRYWIYLTATVSRAEAIEASKSLARDKIKDYYIVHGGEHNNRLSLGHFREKMHADRRLAKLQKLGYDPVMQPLYHDYEVYWLDYSIEQQQHDENDPVNIYIADEVSRLARECEQ